MNRNEVERAVDEITNILIGHETLASVLQTVAEIATRTLDGCDEAGVMLLDTVNGGVKGTARTHELVERIDVDQYASGEGPCVDALSEGRTMRTGHAHRDERWPAFGKLAAKHGVVSVLAFPLEVEGNSIGALNLYGRSEDAFTNSDENIGAFLSAHAAVVLANAAAHDDTSQHVANLKRALESRGVIERAKGILMERENCSADEAFEMLVSASQRLNIKLRDIAADVVDRADPDPK